ncbi:MAG: UvrD-helicase domain-containing protein [Acidimicrobiales bacterium]|nr:UvrD-helicase domain-containing protein [Acidimicrobiales bacterium]
MTRVEPFDLAGPLPSGFTALEASAGTGKTFSIAGMVTRYVADGYEIGRILVVTFTKAAAAELRDRIRGGLEAALEAVTDSLAGSEPEGLDPVLTAVCAAEPIELRRRRDRLERALSDFDTATISTIHSYAQNLLAEQGMSGDANPDAMLLEDTSIVLEQAVADVLTQRAIDGRPWVDPSWVTNGADEAMRRDYAQLLPSRQEVEAKIEAGTGNARFKERCHEVAELAEVVDQVVQRVKEIRRRRAILGFDDLLSAARDLAVDPSSGLAETVRGQIDIALIDEFQDTDPVQWRLVQALFGTKHFTLVGDPKQSIYRFRGADVNTYVGATARAQVSTLTRNFRSDHRILRGIEALFDGATFGDQSIRFHPVECGQPDLGLLQVNANDKSGVEIRFCPDLSAKADVGRAQIAIDVAATVVELLNHGTIPDESDPDGRRPVRPADIAILIKAHSVAPSVQRALRVAGVPSVVGKVGSVFHTEAALQLLTLLRAVAFPASERRVRAAALSWFVDARWDQLEGDTSIVSDLQAEMAEWGEVLQTEGLNAFFDRAWQSRNLAERLIRGGDGLRNLTDLNHIRELLEADVSANHVHRLVERLTTLMSRQEEEEGESDAFARRTDSDDDAVQIMTIHVSKGLEFPIVLSLGLEGSPRANAPVSVEDPIEGRRVLLPPKSSWPDTSGVLDRARSELDGEFRRLIYVAATRARHLSIIYFGSASGAAKKNKGELAHILFAGPASESGVTAAQALSLPSVLSEGAFRAVTIDPARSPGVWHRPSLGSDRTLSAATLDRPFDRAQQRWSFTRISGQRMQVGEYREEGASGLLTEHAPEQGVADEATPDGLTVDDSTGAGSSLPLGSIQGGAAFGTLVHEVLEAIDFAAPDLTSEVAERVGTAVKWSDWDADAADLAGGLISAIETPLGPLFDGRRLRDFGTDDVLDEMSFELPLAPSVPEGRRPTGVHIGRLIQRHLGSDHALSSWAHELADGAIAIELAGHLTGAIDGVFRVRSADRPDRYVVVDYKTNRLGTYGEPLEIDDYDHVAMAAAMAHHDYPLQALLYAVAVHRYLRWRLGDDYEPAQNLGGAAYLFIRGMIGQTTPLSGGSPHGVFSWHIPPDLVVDLSDLLHIGVSG